jgi:hypothetical protein
MRKLKKIPCKTCKKKFLPKSEKNVFCNRKCFKKDFYHRKKIEELNSIKFPTFKCPSCFRNIELTFDPVKDEKLWLGFSCPFCNILMISVCEKIVAQDSSIF